MSKRPTPKNGVPLDKAHFSKLARKSFNPRLGPTLVINELDEETQHVVEWQARTLATFTGIDAGRAAMLLRKALTRRAAPSKGLVRSAVRRATPSDWERTLDWIVDVVESVKPEGYDVEPDMVIRRQVVKPKQPKQQKPRIDRAELYRQFMEVDKLMRTPPKHVAPL